MLKSPEEVERSVIERQPLWNDRKSEHGPFDIIGDVHGCFDELEELLSSSATRGHDDGASWRHPAGTQGRSSSATWSIVGRGSPDVLRW